MSTAYERLDQAMKDLVEAYVEIQDELEATHGDDEESVNQGLIESLETAVDSAIEEHDFSTTAMGTVLSNLGYALEQLDPTVFDEDESEEEEYEVEEMDDEEIDDIDLEDDEEEDDEDDEDEDEDEDEDDEDYDYDEDDDD